MTPLVAIHIPTYRQAHCLARSVKSALAQDYDHLEVIVSDDNSPDATAEAIRPFLNDPRFRYHRNAANLGRVRNYHQGLHTLARSDWFLNLDGDDWLVDPTFVSRAMAFLDAQQDPDHIVAIAAGRRSDGLGTHTSQPIEFPENRRLSSREAFLDYTGRDGRYLTHLTTLVRRSSAMSIGFYTRDILSADLLGLRLLVLSGDVLLLPGVVGVWAQSASSASHAPPLRLLLANFSSFYEPYLAARNHPSVAANPPELAAWLHRACRQYLANLSHYRGIHSAPRRRWLLALLVTALLHYPRAFPVLLHHIRSGQG